jgi:outer membrane protein
MGSVCRKTGWGIGFAILVLFARSGAAERVKVDESLSDPCAPIEWRGDTPWAIPVSTNMIRLTLDEVIAKIFSDSVTLQLAEAAVRSAQREVSIQRSAYWPSLSFESTWGEDYDGRGHRDSDSDAYTASLNATWVLFDGFDREMSVLKAVHDRKATEFAAQEARRGLHQVISSVWFATVLAQDRMDAAQQDILFNQNLLAIEIQKYQADVGRRSDILNFKVKLMEAVDTYFSQRLLFDSNVTILERLMQTHGVLSVDTHRFIDPYPDQFDFIDMDLEEQIRYARHIRSDIRQQEEVVASAKADVNLARGSRLPTLTLLADYSTEHDSTYEFNVPDDAAGYVGVTLEWPLFSGFSSHHEIIQSKTEQQIAEIELEDLEQGLREELTTLFKNYKNALHLYFNASLRRDAALEDRKLVMLLYQNNLVQMTRLNEVQKDSVLATEEFIKSRVRVGEAWEAILIATGRMRPAALAPESYQSSTNTAALFYIQDLQSGPLLNNSEEK